MAWSFVEFNELLTASHAANDTDRRRRDVEEVRDQATEGQIGLTLDRPRVGPCFERAVVEPADLLPPGAGMDADRDADGRPPKW